MFARKTERATSAQSDAEIMLVEALKSVRAESIAAVVVSTLKTRFGQAQAHRIAQMIERGADR
jgi:hypothetical protein